MLAKRVTRVTLAQTTEATPGDHTYLAGTPMWLVEWTLTYRPTGKTETLRQSHYTESAARQHAGNLVEMRVEGLSVEDVYSESV